MTLKWLRKVVSNGKHNAFTSLTFFKGRYLLGFRHGENHGSPGGRQVLMTSPDGEAWTFAQETAFPAPPSVPSDTLIDARDCWFLPLQDELRLYSFAHGPFLPEEDRYLLPVQATVQTTRDGENWTAPRTIREGVVLWKPIHWRGSFWCAGYHRAAAGYENRLYRSSDGFEWTEGPRIATGNECFLLPSGEASLRAFVRTQDPPCHLELWDSQAPFMDWRKVATLPKVIQAPHVARVGDRLYLFGREAPQLDAPDRRPARCRTKIWALDGTEAREVLELPSLGDTAYVGTVVRPDGLLLVSYYSQHEREQEAPPETRGGNDKPSDVFVAGIEV